MRDLACTICRTPLTGGADTFGGIHTPVCLECHLALWAESEKSDQWGELRSAIKRNNGEIEILVTLDKTT